MLLVWFLFAERASVKSRMLCSAMFVAGFGLMLCVTPIANLMSPAGRTVAIPGNAGRALWQGNNPLADGFYNWADGTPSGDAFIARHGFKARLEQADAFEKDRLYRQLALLWIREHPGSFGLLCLKKLNNAFGLFPQAQVFERDPRARWIHLLTYGLLLPFALCGFIASRRRWRSCALLHLVLVSYSLMVVVFYGTPRFTLLVIPVLLVFASLGMTTVFDAIVLKRRGGTA
jgi:hypothetical protein